MVDCLLPRANAKLRSMLDVPPSARSVQIFVETKPATCLSGGIAHGVAVPDRYTRGAVAEAVLKHDFTSLGVSKTGASSPVFDMASATRSDGLTDKAREALMVLQSMQCVVKSAPTQSFAVFVTPVTSDDERVAIEALAPAIEKCRPENVTLPTASSLVRAILAEAAYRQSAAMSAGKE